MTWASETADDYGIPTTRHERHKGFALDYWPRAGSDRERYMDAAEMTIGRYRAQRLTLSTRAIGYRVAADLGVGHRQLDNIEDAIVMLRRTGRVDMDAVDDARSTWERPWMASATVAAKRLHAQLATLVEDRQVGQTGRVTLLSEAAGMMPLLSGLCTEYGVPLVSGSGSVPLSVTHDLAAEAVGRFERTGVTTTVLVITDLDMMGLKQIFRPLAHDIEAFAGAYGAADAVQVRRIAATAAQVEEHVPPNLRLPPPAGEPWWPWPFSLPAAEALADVLPGIVAEHFDDLLPDAEVRAAVVAREPAKRTATAAALAGLLSAGGQQPAE